MAGPSKHLGEQLPNPLFVIDYEDLLAHATLSTRRRRGGPPRALLWRIMARRELFVREATKEAGGDAPPANP
jgi:hypothetical protein